MSDPPLAAWGLSGDPQALPGGHRNTVLRVGDHVLKTTRRSAAALRWLGPVQDRAARAGLHAPRLLESTKGTLCVDGWTCEPLCAGGAASLSDISDRIAEFHRLTSDVPQRPGFASARALLETDTGGDIDLAAMPKALVETVRTHWARLDANETAVHADLNPSNILCDTAGRITLIDWDEARRDVPLFDNADAAHPARIAWEVACCWQVEPDRARALAQQLSD